MKILITGSKSYIGEKFEEYVGYYRPQWQVNTVDVKGDAWKMEQFEGYDTIVHVAGIAHIRETEENKGLYYEVNHRLAVDVARKALQEGVKQFIFLSSMSVYGLETGIITKDTKPSPTTNYGKSKLLAEGELCEMRSDSFRVAILRPPMIYGEGCKGNYNSLIKFAEACPIFPSIKNARSMLHIDKLCEFLVNAIEDCKEGLFFPQDEEYVCTSEMVKAIAEEKGKKLLLVSWLNPFVWLAGKMPGRIGSMANKAFGTLIYDMDRK